MNWVIETILILTCLFVLVWSLTTSEATIINEHTTIGTVIRANGSSYQVKFNIGCVDNKQFLHIPTGYGGAIMWRKGDDDKPLTCDW